MRVRQGRRHVDMDDQGDLGGNQESERDRDPEEHRPHQAVPERQVAGGEGAAPLPAVPAVGFQVEQVVDDVYTGRGEAEGQEACQGGTQDRGIEERVTGQRGGEDEEVLQPLVGPDLLQERAEPAIRAAEFPRHRAQPPYLPRHGPRGVHQDRGIRAPPDLDIAPSVAGVDEAAFAEPLDQSVGLRLPFPVRDPVGSDDVVEDPQVERDPLRDPPVAGRGEDDPPPPAPLLFQVFQQILVVGNRRRVDGTGRRDLFLHRGLPPERPADDPEKIEQVLQDGADGRFEQQVRLDERTVQIDADGEGPGRRTRQ